MNPAEKLAVARKEIMALRKLLVFADGLAVSQTGNALADLYASDCTWAQDALSAAGCHPRKVLARHAPADQAGPRLRLVT